MRRNLLWLGLFFLASVSLNSVLAQTAPFDPIPANEKPLYKFDLTKFYSNQGAVAREIIKLKEEAVEIQKFRGHVTSSANNLYKALALNDEFSREFDKLYYYLELQYDTNTLNTAPHQEALSLSSALEPCFTFVSIELQNMSESRLERYIREEPRLAVYRYAIEDSLRSKPFTLPVDQEQLLTSVSPLIYDWSSDEYALLMDRASWGTVFDPTDGQTFDVREQDAETANSPLRSVRKLGYDQTHAAYKAERDLFAFDVIHVAQAQNAIAKLHHFVDGENAAYFNDYLTESEVDSALNQIFAHGGIPKQLQTMRRDRIKQFTGYTDVHSYDMTVLPPGVVKPRFTIDESRAIILDFTSYLGPEYAKQMSDLLDARNGRLDIVNGPNRMPNAFATLQNGYNSVFYDYGYEGYLDDLSTLSHEAGHAVDNGLENDASVIPSNSDGPRYFTESYAILNEFVLHDYLYQHATDPSLRVYYLESLLREMSTFYSNAQITEIEKNIYEGVDKGTINNANDLDNLSHKISSKVSIWYDLEPQLSDLWEEVPHYYQDPTYMINYVFADLLAQTYFTQYKKDPIGFGKRFTALERNGFNDTPEHLLKKFLGIDLNDSHTFDAVFAAHEEYLTQLQALYNQVPVQTPAQTVQQ